MTKSHPSTKKAKARVMWADPVADAYGKKPSLAAKKDYWHTDVCLVIPIPTLKAARARKRFEGMDREAKVEVLAKAICDHSRNWEGAWDDDTPNAPGKDGYRMDARACLRVIEGE